MRTYREFAHHYTAAHVILFLENKRFRAPTMWKSALVSVALLCVLTRGSETDDANMNAFRLPGTTRPTSYDLLLVPRLNGPGDSAFGGVAKIAIAADAGTGTITLNAKDLDVTEVSAEEIAADGATAAADRGVPVVAGWECVPRNEQLVIRLRSPVVSGRRYVVTVRYEGRFRDDETGWYLSSYDDDHVTKWFAVTQFEPTYARYVLPCYDEPAYKAVFTVSMRVKRKNQTVLSNMPIRHVEIDSTGENDTETVHFEPTPLMSTYLLAFYVGDFVPNKNGSKITIYTNKYAVDQAEYAWNEAPKHVHVMENYTGIPFELPKLDLVALPKCFFGAMENWGMNTYREVYVLLHNESKTKMKIHSSTVMQHEIVHNWFGNLVTCAWWDYTWLNEGFARYFQFFATGMVRTTWPVEEWFVIEAHQYSMACDQTPKHPITASVKTPEEIHAIFDEISYSKAASVLRMLRYLITEDLFKLSLQYYLKTYKYNVTVPKDLFSSFDKILLNENYTIGNELSVYQFMSNWTLQSGYPVLHITKNETTSTFSVTQSQFFINNTGHEEKTSQAWHVGLTYTTELRKNFNYSQPSAWTSKTSALTVVSAPTESGWYIFNIRSTGYYRVNYDADNWMALIDQLKNDHEAVHVVNRGQLIDDAFALARAGLLDYSTTLTLTEYLKNENSVAPFYTAMNGFSYLLDRMPRNQKAYEQFKAYVGRLVGCIYKKIENLVSNGTADFNVLCAWNSFSVWACQLDNAECTATAMEYFGKWESGETIPADIKDAAFCTGVKTGTGDGAFGRMFQLYAATASISERTSAQLALGCSANRTQLTEYINRIFDGTYGQDYSSIVHAISVTPLGLDVLCEFLLNNLNRILEEVPNGESIVKTVYSTLAYKVTDDEMIEKLRLLKDNSNLTSTLKWSFDSSFELVKSNLAWFNVYSGVVGGWLVKNEEEEKYERGKTQKYEREKKEKYEEEEKEEEEEDKEDEGEGEEKVVIVPISATSPIAPATTGHVLEPSGASTNASSSFMILLIAAVFLFFVHMSTR